MTFEDFLLKYDHYINLYLRDFVRDSELISSNIENYEFQNKELKFFIYNSLVNSNISCGNISQDLKLIKKYYFDNLKDIYLEYGITNFEISRIIKISDYFMCKKLDEIILLFVVKYAIFRLKDVNDNINKKIKDTRMNYDFILDIIDILVSHIDYYVKYYPSYFPYYQRIRNCADRGYMKETIKKELIKKNNVYNDTYLEPIRYNHEKIFIPVHSPCNYFCKYGNVKLLDIFFSTRNIEVSESEYNLIESCFYISSYYGHNDIFIYLKNRFSSEMQKTERFLHFMRICGDIFIKRNNITMINYMKNDQHLKVLFS